jgi:hypothetical protein
MVWYSNDKLHPCLELDHHKALNFKLLKLTISLRSLTV